MPDVAGRRRAVTVALVAAAILVALVPAVGNSASTPPRLERFLYALGQVESSGRYTARNASSGAYGKYQIMPSNWPAWARLYLGNAKARPTPQNQEKVARLKVTALYRWLDEWPIVAHWWLTGSSERNPAKWSSFSRSYVQKVMKLMGPAKVSTAKAPAKAGPTAWIDRKDPRVGDGSGKIAYRSSWSTAGYAAYSDRRVHYSTRKGATASLTFSGSGIAWIGPVGPTRGTATVLVDGRKVATVNLYRPDFTARSLLFARALPTGKHTIRIVVTSTGKPVAIDELIVGR